MWPARVQRRVGNALDPLDQRLHLRVGHLLGLEVVQAARRRRTIALATQYCTLNCALTRGLSPRLNGMADQLVRSTAATAPAPGARCAGFRSSACDQLQHQLGDALRHAAARVLLEHHLHQPPFAAEAGDHRRAGPAGRGRTGAVAVDAVEEVRRPGDAVLRHLRTFDAGLRHPALDHAHRQRAVDVALEAAAAAVERQAQRVQRLPRVRRRTRAAAAVDANTMATPVGSKPSYIDSVRLKRAPSSQPTASAARNSAPLQPPRSSAAANAAGTTDEPMWMPGAIASQ